jgi:hypothetical protein
VTNSEIAEVLAQLLAADLLSPVLTCRERSAVTEVLRRVRRWTR